MKHLKVCSLLLALSATLSSGQIDLGTFSFDPRANIWGAGQPLGQRTPSPGGGGGGVEALVIPIPAGTDRIITLPNMLGNLNVNFGGFCSADGIKGTIHPTGYNGLSGVIIPRFACLLGVFTTDSAPTNPKPPTLDFRKNADTFIQISPQLHQVFFVGDGRTGYNSKQGNIQRFRVPDGATKLYLGVPDSGKNGLPGQYNDNSGSLQIKAELSGKITAQLATAELKDAVALSIKGTVGAVYTIEVSSDSVSWKDHEQVLLQTSPQLYFSLRDTSRRFFRVKGAINTHMQNKILK